MSFVVLQVNFRQTITVNTAYKIHEAEYLLRQSDTHTLVMIESALDSNYRKIINEICPDPLTGYVDADGELVDGEIVDEASLRNLIDKLTK